MKPEQCVPSCGGKLYDRYGKGTSQQCYKCSRTWKLEGKIWTVKDPAS